MSESIRSRQAVTRRDLGRLALGLGAAGLAGTARAQERYPERPINCIVAFPAGGGTDVAARSVARYIEKHLGQGASLVVINRPGAGGEIGWTEIATARPDGYTIGFINLPAINALTIGRRSRYTMDSFDPIANLVYDPGAILVAATSTQRSAADLIAAARARPGEVTVGIAGARGAADHLALLAIERAANVRFNVAPFAGTAPLRAALMGGHVPAAAYNLSEALDELREGRVRVLGVAAESRSVLAPQVATFREQGVDVIAGSARGLAAPKGLPPAILKRLQDAAEAALKDPEYVSLAERNSIPLRFMGAEEYAAFIGRTQADLEALWAASPWR